MGRALGPAESGAQSCKLVCFLPLNHHGSSESSPQLGGSVFTGDEAGQMAPMHFRPGGGESGAGDHMMDGNCASVSTEAQLTGQCRPWQGGACLSAWELG